MGLMTIRKMTNEDRARIRAAATRFLARHPQLACASADDDPEEAILSALANAEDSDYPISRDAARYLRRLWLAAFRRAVREPAADGHGWGCIGYHVS